MHVKKEQSAAQTTSQKWLSYLPGIGLVLLIAAAAEFIESILPIDVIGASVIAIFSGILINYFWTPTRTFAPGIQFSSKRILKFAIILLGASLNVATILSVGQLTIGVLFFTLLTAFGGGYLIGKALNLDWKLAGMLSAGTAICGGSAIASVAPVIDSEDHDVAYAISTVFLIDMFLIILFPLIGQAIGLSDTAFGLWAGTAVNDTSSVVAAGYAFSEGAGDFATMVKVTRTLMILPTVLIFSVIGQRAKQKESLAAGNSRSVSSKVDLRQVFPWFIVIFILMAVLNSVGLFSAELSGSLKQLSGFLMVAALAAIGLKTDITKLKQSGAKPLLMGVLLSISVASVSLAVLYFMSV